MPPIEMIPSARRMMKSLRDMGYDFSQAVADVIDNSITAEATEIRIDAHFEGDESWVRIVDNGTGMRPDSLREALRYGAEREYEEDDLGKFGLGLKTASMSQCRRLSVASRWNKKRAEISAYSWDLDHIEKVNRWEIVPVKRNDAGPALYRLLEDQTGTVVAWEQLDRILGYKHPYGDAARARLAQMCRELEQHLGMVFHRFISGHRGKKLQILLNGNEIRPWDPFCRSESRTDKWEPFFLQVDEDGVRGAMRIEPFVLPHQSEFSSPGGFKIAAGPNGWNQQQGLYIYRAGRLIQSGGWSRLRTADEHTKLARMAVSFQPALDEAFKVNVAKMRVQIPSSVRDELIDVAQKLAKAARRAYDRKEKKVSGATAAPTPHGASIAAEPTNQPSPVLGSRVTPTAPGPRNVPTPRLLTLKQWSDETLAVATSREKPFLLAALKRLAPQ